MVARLAALAPLALVATLAAGCAAEPGPRAAPPRAPPAAAPAAEVASPAPEDVAARVRAHLAPSGAVHWIGVSTLFGAETESCIDGRDDHEVIGTPGGDTGEIVLALSAVEQATGAEVDLAHLPALLRSYVASFGRFYLHTDDHALEHLAERLRQDPRFRELGADLEDPAAVERLVRDPPAALREALLVHLVEPDAVGCGHLRLMLQHPGDYGARRALTEAVLREAFRLGWERPEALSFVVLRGRHAERAVLRVTLREGVRAHTRVPVVAPNLRGEEMFVLHPQVHAFMAEETASFFVEHHEELLGPRAVDPRKVEAAVRELSDRQLQATASRLARGLPLLDAELAGERLTAVRIASGGGAR